MSFRKLWVGFAAVVVISFAVLGWTGIRIYQQAPPVPERVIAADGTQLIGTGAIHAGQNVWQSMGGMELGSIWGHGSYVAPDWTADWLHREARSPEFLQTDVIETFRLLRVIGDTVFAAGAIALAAFVIGLRTGGSTRNERFPVPAGEPLSTR